MANFRIVSVEQPAASQRHGIGSVVIGADVGAGESLFEFAMPDGIDPAEYVRVARHFFHVRVTELASETEHWQLSDAELAKVGIRIQR